MSGVTAGGGGFGDMGFGMGSEMGLILGGWDSDEDLTDILAIASAAVGSVMEEDGEMVPSAAGRPKRRRNPDPMPPDPLKSNWALMLAAGWVDGSLCMIPPPLLSSGNT